jgi:hypothetical protein
LLAFIGNVVTSATVHKGGSLAALSQPFLWFGLGVVAAVVAMGFAYLTNYMVASHTFALTVFEWVGHFELLGIVALEPRPPAQIEQP